MTEPGSKTPLDVQHASDRIHAGMDPLGIVVPLLQAQAAWLLHPQELAQRMHRFSADWFSFGMHAWSRAAGIPSADPIRPRSDDARFADPAWTEQASWDILKEWYLLLTRHAQDMLYETPGLSGKQRRRAAFWWRQWLNAVAPTNFLWSNPEALRRALETNGESLRAGWRNYLADLRAGDVRMSDPTDFRVGENLATTAGQVVMRNRLVELIRYTPVGDTQHRVPIVIVPPWINKFYVLDLTPKKSMVQHLLAQGFDVYMLSWCNPGAEMGEVRFDDYLTEGVDAAINAARQHSDAPQVHAVGYCIGGTALAAYMAWAARAYTDDDQPVESWTLLTTLTDFTHPGDIEVFIDEGSVHYLSEAMARRGYLDGREMAMSFRLLRANPLIWHYVVRGWLLGEPPPAFDVLCWNMDTTRMPAAMHGWYLRELYLNNRLIQPDSLTLAGQPIDLGRVQQPLYCVAAEDDHIAPWKQTFRTLNFVRGAKRYVLSSSGHILGIVNPPVDPPKRRFMAGEAHRTDTPQLWQSRTGWQQGTWWEDWTAWLKPRLGKQRPVQASPETGLGAAPGSYVLVP